MFIYKSFKSDFATQFH